LRTIRGRLIVGVVPGLVLLISALSAALYIYMYDVLTLQIDGSLLNRAHVVSGRAHYSETQPGLVSSPDVDYGEFGRSNRPSCFEIFASDGTPLVRSQLLGNSDLPVPVLKGDEPVYLNVTFPNGRPGRAIALRYSPSSGDSGESPPGAHSQAGNDKEFIIVLAKDAGPVRDPTTVLLLSLIALVGLMATGIIVLMSLALRRGLEPLELIAKQAASRSPDDSPDLFPTDGMPGELLPICDRLNDLLRRLYNALQRQRRFTTDAAHELRTPIAEIRAVAEVASKWGDVRAARTSLADVLEVAAKMESIVTNLLAMARCDLSKQALSFQAVELNPLIEKVWQTLGPRAQGRDVTIQMNLAPSALVQIDPALFESVLVNLLGNAAEYATAGSAISCGSRLSDDGLQLEIANDVDDLRAEDVPLLFEPFWRKDASRADDRHSGLGLTLTKAYAEALNVPLSVELRGNRLYFCLRLRPGAGQTAEKSAPIASDVSDAPAPQRA
jgi:signal transduction histidine kinase